MGQGGTEPADDCTFFYGHGNENHQDIFIHTYIRESRQQLRGYSVLVIECI
jgi:hypothetical protein